MVVAGQLEMRGSEGIKNENSDTRRKHVGYMRHRKLDSGLTKSVSSIIALISVVLVDFTRSRPLHCGMRALVRAKSDNVV